MSARMRLQQGLRALFSWSRPVDLTPAQTVLSPAEMALFRRLRRSEQLHSLNVLRTVQAAGETDPDLLVAALLHDVGKTIAPFWLPERVLVVLAGRVAPGLVDRLGRHAEPRGWRRPFAISARHPEWSARLLAGAGSTARAIELARRHQDAIPDPPRTETERLLLALQRADDRN